LKGKVSVLDPMTMGLIIGPVIAVLIVLTVALWASTTYTIIKIVIGVVNFLKRRRS
jgi:hypothetical protein